METPTPAQLAYRKTLLALSRSTQMDKRTYKQAHHVWRVMRCNGVTPAEMQQRAYAPHVLALFDMLHKLRFECFDLLRSKQIRAEYLCANGVPRRVYPAVLVRSKRVVNYDMHGNSAIYLDKLKPYPTLETAP